MSPDAREPTALATVRQILLGLVALGTIGMTIELLLVSHFDDANQLIPLVVGSLGLLAVLWVAVSGSVVSLRTLQFVMLLYAGSGIIGIALHYQENVKLVHEKEPSAAGSELFWKVAQSTAPPALAPGVMVQLGLLGLAFTYKHPAIHRDELDG